MQIDSRIPVSNTKLAAALITCGANLVPDADCPLDVFLEPDPRGGTVRRGYAFFLPGQEVHLPFPEPGSVVKIEELITRYNDIDWCKANPDSPIAFLRFNNDNRERLTDFFAKRAPMVLRKVGERIWVVRATPGADGALTVKIPENVV